MSCSKELLKLEMKEQVNMHINIITIISISYHCYLFNIILLTRFHLFSLLEFSIYKYKLLYYRTTERKMQLK